jgi:hypothetical protein
MNASRAALGLRRFALGAVVLVLIQASVGMVVNLDVTIPDHHPGARPSNYLSGSASSIGWAISHGAPALAIHVTLGLALVIIVIGVAVRAFAVPSTPVRAWSILGALLVIGAGFNGASFLDFNNDISSLIMALLAFAAVACYAIVINLLAGQLAARMAGAAGS